MGPVPKQVLPKTLHLDGAGISGGGTPRPPGQEDPDPSPQRVQGPGGLRPGQAGRVLKKAVLSPLHPFLGPPEPPWGPWLSLGPSGIGPLPRLTEPLPFPLRLLNWAALGPSAGRLFFVKSRDGMKKFYVKKAVGLSLGLNPKRNRFGWLCRLGRRGVGEKC